MSSTPHLLPLAELGARLFASTTEADATLRALWARHRLVVAEVSAPIDRAVLGGASVDRIAWAFLTGYQAALSALVPSSDPAELAAFCVTELGGAHPRAVLSELVPSTTGGFSLNGHKRWSTTVPDVTRLYVVARLGPDVDGRPQLRVASIDATRAGVRFVPMPPAPFVPEVPHGEVLLEDVAVADDELLEGDGYGRYVKPFRTVEDIYVHTAVLAYLFAIARRYEAPAGLVERLFATLIALRSLAREDVRAAATHLALAGLLTAANPLVEEMVAHLATCDSAPAEAERARLVRDTALLGVAGNARETRRANAWAALATDPATRVTAPA